MSRFVIALIAALVCCLCSPAALAGTKRKPDVLFLHTIGVIPTGVNDVVNNLSATGLFGSVAAFDAAVATPKLTELSEYDAVMVTCGQPWPNAAGLGTVLQQYVDAGGGVVQTVYTTAGQSGSNLGGTWTAAYNCIAFGPVTFGNATLGTIADQNHPIMIGVQSFNGGTDSYRPSGTALTPGATLVASWSDGKPLVAVGPKVNRCDLGMLPVSQVFGGGWLSTTDGVKLMANALLHVMRPKVLVLTSDSDVNTGDVRVRIREPGTLGLVDVFNARFGTPTLAQLQKYDAVLAWSDFPFSNSTALGNVLADYVDAGGGVVSAVFTAGFALDPNRLGGRWISGDYEIIPALASFIQGQATLGAVDFPSHPIMNGVASFNGGAKSFRPTSTSLNPGGLIVAKWSDGRTLVAVSTKMHNRVDLGMYPPSSVVAGSGFWDSMTDGDTLMANALLYTVKPYVACVAADPAMDDTVNKLTASRRFSGVARIDANAAVPALATLSPFHAVATWTNSPYANPTAFGNTLADYVDAGGGVVTALFGNTSFSSPQGRWITEGYEITPSPLPSFITNAGQQSLGQVLEPAHPIASFVRKFDGGFNSPRQDATPLLRGRTVMTWTDGKMLTSVHNFKKRADLGYYTVSGAVNADLWNQRTDGTWLTANALEFVVRVKPCPGDFNGDGLVDDTDFQLLVGPYDNLIDPRADLTGDGNTDDADFQVFVQAYNQLLCP